MSFVQLPTTPPYHTIAVDPDKVFAVVPEVTTVNNNDAVLLLDGNRVINVLLGVDEAATRLGPSFRKLQASSTDTAPIYVYVNKSMVRFIRPHPQIAGAVHVYSVDRMLAIVGSVDSVSTALA